MDINSNLSNAKLSSDCSYIIISEESQGMFYIFQFNPNSEPMFGDDCYFSLEEAKFHCMEFYQIDENAWYECPPPSWGH